MEPLLRHIPDVNNCLLSRTGGILPFSPGKEDGIREPALDLDQAADDYVFNLDAVRVPSKYPQKRYFEGTRTASRLKT